MRDTTSRWREALYLFATIHTPPDTAAENEIIITDPATGTQIVVTPASLWCGVTSEETTETIVEHLADGDWQDILNNNEIPALLMSFCKNEQPTAIGVITIWECEAGTQYIPGEVDDYFADAQYVGYIDPKTMMFVAAD